MSFRQTPPGHEGNRGLLDWQLDGQIDLSDAVRCLSHLFLGGPAHAVVGPGIAGSDCLRVLGCGDNVRCP